MTADPRLPVVRPPRSRARDVVRAAARRQAALGLLSLGVVTLSLPGAPAQAQGWPEKPIKLVTPSSAGGPPDVYARALADHLGRTLGQPTIVENNAGVGGMIASQVVQRAAPDGYTLLTSTAGSMTIIPAVNAKARYVPGDFTNLCQGVEASLVLAAHPSIGARQFAQLAQWIKAEKTPPTYSSWASGSPGHFVGYQLSEVLKVDMVHVPYKSSPQQITDMLSGVAPLGFVQIATATPYIKEGRLIAYATTAATRAPQLPDVPTVTELGMPELTTTVWFGLAAPKNLPEPVRQKLVAAHEAFTTSPEVAQRLAAAGMTVTPGICGDALLKKSEAELVRWGRVAKAIGFVAD